MVEMTASAPECLQARKESALCRKEIREEEGRPTDDGQGR